MVIWDVLIAHHRQLYAGKINLKDSASLIVLWWFVLQKHWETPSVEYFTCVNMGSSWPQSLINSENGSICALGGDQGVTQNSLVAQRPLLWICSRWWSDQGSRSHPELCCVFTSPSPAAIPLVESCTISRAKIGLAKSNQKDLLSFDPFSPHPIMQSFPL